MSDWNKERFNSVIFGYHQGLMAQGNTYIRVQEDAFRSWARTTYGEYSEREREKLVEWYLRLDERFAHMVSEIVLRNHVYGALEIIADGIGDRAGAVLARLVERYGNFGSVVVLWMAGHAPGLMGHYLEGSHNQAIDIILGRRARGDLATRPMLPTLGEFAGYQRAEPTQAMAPVMATKIVIETTPEWHGPRETWAKTDKKGGIVRAAHLDVGDGVRGGAHEGTRIGVADALEQGTSAGVDCITRQGCKGVSDDVRAMTTLVDEWITSNRLKGKPMGYRQSSEVPGKTEDFKVLYAERIDAPVVDERGDEKELEAGGQTGNLGADGDNGNRTGLAEVGENPWNGVVHSDREDMDRDFIERMRKEQT